MNDREMLIHIWGMVRYSGTNDPHILKERVRMPLEEHLKKGGEDKTEERLRTLERIVVDGERR